MRSILLKSLDYLELFPWFNRYTADTATVFMLHCVQPDGEDVNGEVTVENFRRFLDYLKQNSYTVLSLREYIDALKNRRSTYKSVVFTVDDGYRNFYVQCYPLLREYDYPATVFVTTDFIEKRMFMWWDKVEFAISSTSKEILDLSRDTLGKYPIATPEEKAEATHRIVELLKKHTDEEKCRHIDAILGALEVDIQGQPSGKYEPLTWDEIKVMSQNGIDFFPHSQTHPIMSRLPYEKKLTELRESKRILEEKLGRTLDVFSYPNGGVDDIDAGTIGALKEAGYSVALTSIPGFNSTKTDNDLYLLHRFSIPAKPLWFKQYVSGLEYVKERFRRSLQAKPQPTNIGPSY